MLLLNLFFTLGNLWVATLLSGCGHSEKEYQKLVEENARLKAQAAKNRGPLPIHRT